jgi:hypothetical protein
MIAIILGLGALAAFAVSQEATPVEHEPEPVRRNLVGFSETIRPALSLRSSAILCQYYDSIGEYVIADEIASDVLPMVPWMRYRASMGDTIAMRWLS